MFFLVMRYHEVQLGTIILVSFNWVFIKFNKNIIGVKFGIILQLPFHMTSMS